MARSLFKKLTQKNMSYFFKQQFYDMEPCIYESGYFMFSCVQRLASKHRTEVIYISQTEDSVLYRMTASYGFWVNGYMNKDLEHINEDQSFMFDPKQLVC